MKNLLLTLISLFCLHICQAQDTPIIEKQKRNSFSEQKLRFGVYGGASYLLGKLPENINPSMEQYLKRLKTGHHIGCDFAYFFKSNVGVGVKYSLFNTRNKMGEIYYDVIILTLR